VYQAAAEAPERKVVTKLPDVTLKELLLAFHDVLQRAEMFSNLHVQREPLSVRQRMAEILSRLRASTFTGFSSLFDPEEGRMGVTVTFLAVLELVKEALIDIVQAEPFGPIHVRAAQAKANHNRLTEDSQEQSTN
jgi:segregation and condensation protein A